MQCNVSPWIVFQEFNNQIGELYEEIFLVFHKVNMTLSLYSFDILFEALTSIYEI